MATRPNIFGELPDQFLANLGTAILQIKNARGLTLIDMASVMGRGDDMIGKYIAGEAEMGVIAYLRAIDAWPEMLGIVAETATERALRSRQRPLDLDMPARRSAAA